MAPKENPNALGRQGLPPRPTTSKPAILQERLSASLSDLEITDGMNELIIKPHRFLGDAWKDVNDAVRSLDGRWIRIQKPGEGVWRIRK